MRVEHQFGHGTGVYLGRGVVLTAEHVLPTRGAIYVYFEERLVGAARVLASDAENDLALLSVDRIDTVGARALSWGDVSQLREGDDVLAIGFPAALPLTVKAGVVSAIYLEGTLEVIQTDANLNPGMSGGPVLNASGQLVGISVATHRLYPGLGFVVGGSTARQFVDRNR